MFQDDTIISIEKRKYEGGERLESLLHNEMTQFLKDCNDKTPSFRISRGHSREDFTLVEVKEDGNKSKQQSKS